MRVPLGDGTLSVDYFDNKFPLAPRTYNAVLTHRLDEFRDTVSEEVINCRRFFDINEPAAVCMEERGPKTWTCPP